MEHRDLLKIVRKYGTPTFIYDFDRIKMQYDKLNALSEGQADLYYSMKANPTIGICQQMNCLTQKIEVSSLGEIYGALKAGYRGINILFSGPGKTLHDLKVALKQNIKINIESIQELILIKNLCSSWSLRANILLRINPDYHHLKNSIIMSGISSQFGLDFLELEKCMDVIENSPDVNLLGFTVYYGSQILDAELIAKNSEEIIRIAIGLKKKYNLKIKELDLGGGFGVDYFHDKELDMLWLGSKLKELLHSYRNELEGVKIALESGRFLMSDAGYYITRILYKKVSKEKNYLICDGGLNHILGSSFYNRELRESFPIEVLNKAEPREEYYVAGPLCTPKDIFGRKVMLAKADRDDYIIVRKIGAYGFTFSPYRFISHTAPAEVMWKQGKHYLLRKRERYKEIFQNQIVYE